MTNGGSLLRGLRNQLETRGPYLSTPVKPEEHARNKPSHCSRGSGSIPGVTYAEETSYNHNSLQCRYTPYAGIRLSNGSLPSPLPPDSSGLKLASLGAQTGRLLDSGSWANKSPSCRSCVTRQIQRRGIGPPMAANNRWYAVSRSGTGLQYQVGISWLR